MRAECTMKTSVNVKKGAPTSKYKREQKMMYCPGYMQGNDRADDICTFKNFKNDLYINNNYKSIYKYT